MGITCFHRYATCSVCGVGDKLEKKSSDTVEVDGTLDEKYHWFIWTEEALRKGLQGTFTQPYLVHYVPAICSKKE